MLQLKGKNYKIASDIILEEGKVPLTYWTLQPNFGDLLSAYLVEKLTSLSVKHVRLRPRALRKSLFSSFKKEPFSYFAIGSIIRRNNSKSIVWGSGSFGTEGREDFDPEARILAVRGPLTRNFLRIYNIECPEVYGDPALIIPEVFNPVVEKKYKVGVVLRWAEDEWDRSDFGDDVKKINMSSTDIEGTLTEMLECERILSSSLHGIILADAYDIPSAWLSSTTPKGLEFKFYDYFLSVGKVQRPQYYNFLSGPVSYKTIEKSILFDNRKIVFNFDKLIEACPFIEPQPG